MTTSTRRDHHGTRILAGPLSGQAPRPPRRREPDSPGAAEDVAGGAASRAQARVPAARGADARARAATPADLLAARPAPRGEAVRGDARHHPRGPVDHV